MQMYPLAGKYGLYSQAKENSENLNKEEDNWLFFGAPTWRTRRRGLLFTHW